METMRLIPAVRAVFRQAVVDMDVGEYTVPAGTSVGVALSPNLHTDPLRAQISAGQRRCPFDIHGIDRSELRHDSFDYNPDRWLLQE